MHYELCIKKRHRLIRRPKAVPNGHLVSSISFVLVFFELFIYIISFFFVIIITDVQ